MPKGYRINPEFWKSNGETITSLYEIGFSSRMIADHLKKTITGFIPSSQAIAGFLSSKGRLRNLSEAGKISRENGRQDHNSRGKGLRRPGQGHHTFLDKECEHCHERFVALAANQKWCDICAPDTKSKKWLRLYGLSKPEADALLASQHGSCALCPRSVNLVPDHSHKTGVVRGLLCYGCNIALNRIEIDNWALRAQEYVTVPSPHVPSHAMFMHRSRK